MASLLDPWYVNGWATVRAASPGAQCRGTVPVRLVWVVMAQRAQLASLSLLILLLQAYAILAHRQVRVHTPSIRW